MIAELRVGVERGRVTELSAPPPLGAKVLPGRTGPDRRTGRHGGRAAGGRPAAGRRCGSAPASTLRCARWPRSWPIPARVAADGARGRRRRRRQWVARLVARAAGGVRRRPATWARSASTSAPGRAVRWVEEIVLGRRARTPGRPRCARRCGSTSTAARSCGTGSTQRCPGFAGPAVAGASRYFGAAVLAGPDVVSRPVEEEPDWLTWRGRAS